MPKSEEFNKEAIITNRTSFRFHQKSSQPISRLASLRQKFANISSLEASHGSCNPFFCFTKKFSIFIMHFVFALFCFNF